VKLTYLDGVAGEGSGVGDLDVDRDRQTGHHRGVAAAELDAVAHGRDKARVDEVLHRDGLGGVNAASRDELDKIVDVDDVQLLAVDVLEAVLRGAAPKHGLATFVTRERAETRASALTLLTTAGSLAQTRGAATAETLGDLAGAGHVGKVAERHGARNKAQVSTRRHGSNRGSGRDSRGDAGGGQERRESTEGRANRRPQRRGAAHAKHCD